MLETLTVTSALASSISSRIRTVIRSDTSVTAVAMFSEWLVSAGKALEDEGEHETSGEGGAHSHFWALLDDLRRGGTFRRSRREGGRSL
jgi:hypothetical protein